MGDTRVVNLRDELCDVYIGRPSKWGNPFKVGRDGTRDECIRKYRSWLPGSGRLIDIGDLRGKRLGCWCAPLACHGDVLLEFLALSPTPD